MATWPIFPLISHNVLQTSISNMASSTSFTFLFSLSFTFFYPHFPSFNFIFLRTPSFSFINLHSPSFILIHLHSNSFTFIHTHPSSLIFIYLNRPTVIYSWYSRDYPMKCRAVTSFISGQFVPLSFNLQTLHLLKNNFAFPWNVPYFTLFCYTRGS